MKPFDFSSPTRLVFGTGAFARLGELACELNFKRTLLVADDGIIACGYVEQATQSLQQSGIKAFIFHDFNENPDTAMVEAGRIFAKDLGIDSIIALGGGSSLDCAKGINFLLSGGGTMHKYWGHDKLSSKPDAKPMLPMIGVPTTAGTGSDAQSYTLISDAETHTKMACGDRQAAFKIALLDPQLTVTMPMQLTAITGYDALSHAVESYVTKARTPLSQMLAREAWRLLGDNYERALNEPTHLEARGAMLLGSYFAGLAIEHSMLGATHACANPLTKHFGVTHGVAIAVMLPHIVRWNRAAVGNDYAELTEGLAQRLEQLRAIGELPATLTGLGIVKQDLPRLADEAAKQWTGGFNPRDWSFEGALEVYQNAL